MTSWWRASREQRDRDLDDEIQAHLEMAARDRIERGEAPEAARLAARREFGNRDLVKEVTREIWAWTWLETIVQDVRYAWRTMRRTPIVTLVVVLLLALGIGATTAVFTVINALVLRQLPVRSPDQLVELLSRYPGDPRMNYFGWTDYERYRDRSQTLSDLTGMATARFHVSGDGFETGMQDGDYVVGSYFPVLGVQPAIGRLIGPDDDRVGTADAAVVVLSWWFWRERFGLDPSIAGKRIVINDVPATIVGVAPRGFFGLLVGRTPAVWVPTAFESLVQQPGQRASGTMGLALIGRLKPGASLEQARAELSVLDRSRVEVIATGSNDPQWRHATLELEPAGAGLSALRDRYASHLWLLLGIVAVLLLVACASIAGMLAARAATRQREMAVRVALGAGRVRLVRQLLTESLLLSAAGGGLGLLVAYLGADTLVRSWPVDPRSGLQRYDIPLQPDAHVLMFTAAVALTTAMVCGVAPAWQAFARAVFAALRESGAATEPLGRRLFGPSLVAAQVAFSVVLLSVAFMLLGHVSQLRGRDIGFSRDDVLVVALDTGPGGDSEEAREARFHLYRGILERFEAIPGVRSAAMAAVTPIQGGAATQFVDVEGFEEEADARRRVWLNWVSPGYFETLSTPLAEGRDFSARDEGAARVAIVNQRLARQRFGDGRAIGKRLTLERSTHSYEIVGVVGDAKYESLRDAAPPTVYLHAFQEARGRVSQFALRTSVPPASIAGQVRRVAQDASQAIAVNRIRTLADQLDASIVLERLLARLSSAFAGLGAFVAAIGLYGLLAFTVARRTNEIGIRMALGASAGDVIRMVLKSAVLLVSAGLLLGIPLTLWMYRLGVLLVPDFGGDPGTSVVWAAGAMVAVALTAACLPARRAVRVQPVDALRHS
jgi:putative ABC transport system permease protein